MKIIKFKILFVITICFSAIVNASSASIIDEKFSSENQESMLDLLETNKQSIAGNEHLLPKISRSIAQSQFYNKSQNSESIQGSQTFTVGSLQTCDYSTLQAAVDVATSGDVIKVMAMTFSGDNALVNVSSLSLIITGGYNNCTNDLNTGLTTLDGTGMSNPDSIVEITDIFGTASVNISNFIIKNGQDDADYGGGVEISGKANATNQERLVVNLFNVLVDSNASSYGAGVHVTKGKLTLDNASIITGNTASSNGGGIHCTDSDIFVQGDSIIGKDTAQATANQALVGGGLYLDNCFLSQKTTGDLLSGYTGGYVTGNSALLGGGMALYNNSSVTLEGGKAQVTLNTASNGGGLYINEGSMYAFNASIKGNQASTGGGAYLIDGTFSLQRNNNFYCSGKCTELSENTASQKGAALYHFNGAANNNIILDGAWIENNVATDDAAIIGTLGDPEGSYSIKNSMLLNNSITNSASPDINALFVLSGTVDFSMDTSTLSASQSANLTDSAVFNFNNSGSKTLDDSIIGDNGDNFSLALGTTAAFFSSNNNFLKFGASAWNTDPLFLVPGSNYHIRSDSPAIDAGPTGSQIDIDGETRGGLDNPADIGADEANLRVGINGAVCEYASLAQAVTAANSTDTIYLTKGSYFETRLVLDKDLTLVQGDATCENEQANAIASELVIDGSNQFSSAGGLLVVDPNTNVSVKNMTLQRAKANFGGIIYVDSGANLVLENTEVREGFATRYGGGIRSHGNVTLINSKIVNNTATSTDSNDAQSGAGIAISSTGSLILEGDSLIVSNDAVNFGGGIYAENAVTLTDTSKIYANTAINGAGVYIANSANLMLSNAAVIGSVDFQNTASQDGGGIYCSNAVVNLQNGSSIIGNDASNGAGIYASGCTVSLFDIAKIGGTIIAGNTAVADGGGIFMANNSELSLATDAEISYNSAVSGGGIFIGSNSSTVTVEGGKISQNSALFGGGVYILEDSAIINKSLIYANSASLKGSAIRTNISDLIMSNVVLYGNTDSEVFGINGSSNLTLNDSTVVSEVSNNLFDENTDIDIVINLNNTIVSGFNVTTLPENATPNINCTFDSTGLLGSFISPQFVNPTNHDYHLQNTSGIINRCSTGTSSDFDGLPRPVGNGPTPYDAGAFENQTPGISDVIFANSFE